MLQLHLVLPVLNEIACAGCCCSIPTQSACCACERRVHRFTREHRKSWLHFLERGQCALVPNLRRLVLLRLSLAMLAQFVALLQIIVASTTAFLVAGRFGLAPTVKQQATSGLRLVDNGTKGLSTGDPAGNWLAPSKPTAKTTCKSASRLDTK